jgi:hypothetical protein
MPPCPMMIYQALWPNCVADELLDGTTFTKNDLVSFKSYRSKKVKVALSLGVASSYGEWSPIGAQAVL